MGAEWGAMLAFALIKGLSIMLGYVSNNAFPRKLSEEEEAEYIRRYELGDEEARNVLIEHNLRLVAHI
ncbi:MAG: RNA polymerase subunit sigma-70, partial [Firmicutes bacterium]|nr:RNA polymerase subunit sigma-70 [Bacillota bacterium]